MTQRVTQRYPVRTCGRACGYLSSMTKSRPGPTRIIPGKQDRRGADDTGARAVAAASSVSPSTVLFSFQSWRQTWFHFHHGLSPYRSSLADLLFVNTRWYCDPGAPPLVLTAPGAQCHSSDAETIHCLRSSLEMMGLSHSKQQQGMAGSMRQGQHHSPRYDSVMSLEFLL